MALRNSRQWRQRVLVVSLGVIALVTTARVLEYEPRSLGWVTGFAIGTAIVFGPITWAIRDRIPDERRERLSYVAAGVALFCVPLVLGVGLIVGRVLFFLDVAVLGSIIGFAVAVLVERTVVPERLRGTAR
ncbi:hypothetical protein C476_08683 [Natrinema limicola JCM 13563]|uniref:Uncharacterized protein n=1 Tax=Natrinema limicola JCM 13563 TaxID=1230457 RepID=M0CFT9_9EURY|nr:hypothetical protein C476_08683 [Natrinema limicola JCM 13563]